MYISGHHTLRMVFISTFRKKLNESMCCFVSPRSFRKAGSSRHFSRTVLTCAAM